MLLACLDYKLIWKHEKVAVSLFWSFDGFFERDGGRKKGKIWKMSVENWWFVSAEGRFLLFLRSVLAMRHVSLGIRCLDEF